MTTQHKCQYGAGQYSPGNNSVAIEFVSFFFLVCVISISTIIINFYKNNIYIKIGV